MRDGAASDQAGPGVSPGAVAAQADPVAAAAAPATQGKWEQLPFGSEVLAVHAALLPTGKVLFAAGSGNSDVRFNGPGFGDTTLRNWTSVVWDPTINPMAGQDPEFFHPATVRDPQGHVLDLFCGGETLLPDGRVLAAGGTLAYDGAGRNFAGRPDTL